MECLLETKTATIVEFIKGLQGTLSQTFQEGTSARGGPVSPWHGRLSGGPDLIQAESRVFPRRRLTSIPPDPGHATSRVF